MEGVLAMPIAAAIPWTQILKALPYVVDGAKTVLKMTSKPKEAPLDPAQDLREQLASLAERIEATDAAQAEQAKVLAQVAEQLQAIAIRAARGYWLAVGALGLSALAVAISIFRA
jgi:hypothetical protein